MPIGEEGVAAVRMFQDELYGPGLPTQDRGGQATLTALSGPTSPSAFGFTKMFDLPYFGDGQDAADLKSRVNQIGALGGHMDALDPPVTTVNPLDGNEERNPNNVMDQGMTVGFTFLGQFIDHDLTFDPTPLADEAPPDVRNGRTPRFDLDSVYLGGPNADPRLYQRGSKARFKIDSAAPRDLPRDSTSEALIGDPRNDENVIISQLHLSFLKFHNNLVDKLAGENASWKDEILFAEAQRLTRWHYQYIVIEQFLRATIDETVFDDIVSHGPRYFMPPSNDMPREFQVAAYRFGHSQVRPGYKVNGGFGAPIFDKAISRAESDPNDLRGGHRSPRRFVEWDTFFDFGTQEVGIKDGGAVVQPKVKPNKRIDPFLSTAMLKLPVAVGTVSPGEVDNLATRNLFRHIQYKLPSGQSIATAIGATPLAFPELAALQFENNTPLWYYVLGEALQQHQGIRLGTVGSRIIAEVFFCLLASDPESYWSLDRDWAPSLPSGRNPNFKARPGKVPFTMTDFLTFARVA